VINWAASGTADRLDVLLLPGTATGPVAGYLPAGPPRGGVSSYANDPARAAAVSAFLTALRSDLAVVTPPELMPDTFVTLDLSDA
jgi:hypothetical protein